MKPKIKKSINGNLLLQLAGYILICHLVSNERIVWFRNRNRKNSFPTKNLLAGAWPGLQLVDGTRKSYVGLKWVILGTTDTGQ